MVRHTFAIAVVLLASSVARAQAAHAPTFSLAWSAPDGCPGAGDVEAEILRLAGHAPATPMQVTATVTHEGERFRIAILTSSEDGEGSREIEGASCDAIAEAAALIVAMAIDPEAAARIETAETTITAPIETASVPSPVPVPELDPVSAPVDRAAVLAPADPGPATAPTRGPTFLASAQATLGYGALPSASPGAALGLGARIDPIELWAGASFLAEQEKTIETASATFGRATADLRGCVPIALGGETFELAPCVGFELGAIWASPGPLRVRTPATRWWAALEVLAEGRAWVLPELAIVVSASLEVPLWRDTFYVEVPARVDLHTPEIVAFLGGVGLALRVP